MDVFEANKILYDQIDIPDDRRDEIFVRLLMPYGAEVAVAYRKLDRLRKQLHEARETINRLQKIADDLTNQASKLERKHERADELARELHEVKANNAALNEQNRYLVNANAALAVQLYEGGNDENELPAVVQQAMDSYAFNLLGEKQ